MQIITNNQPRHLILKCELSAKEQKEFDYLDTTDALFRYKGALYPIRDFVRIVPRAEASGYVHPADEGSPLLAWHGIYTESYFSGVVIKYLPEEESVIVGRVSW